MPLFSLCVIPASKLKKIVGTLMGINEKAHMSVNSNSLFIQVANSDISVTVSLHASWFYYFSDEMGPFSLEFNPSEFITISNSAHDGDHVFIFIDVVRHDGFSFLFIHQDCVTESHKMSFRLIGTIHLDPPLFISSAYAHCYGFTFPPVPLRGCMRECSSQNQNLHLTLLTKEAAEDESHPTVSERVEICASNVPVDGRLVARIASNVLPYILEAVEIADHDLILNSPIDHLPPVMIVPVDDSGLACFYYFLLPHSLPH